MALFDRRPKSTYTQLVDAGYPRSQARHLTDYVRERVQKFGESREHAVERLLRMPHAEAPKVPA